MLADGDALGPARNNCKRRCKISTSKRNGLRSRCPPAAAHRAGRSCPRVPVSSCPRVARVLALVEHRRSLPCALARLRRLRHPAQLRARPLLLVTESWDKERIRGAPGAHRYVCACSHAPCLPCAVSTGGRVRHFQPGRLPMVRKQLLKGVSGLRRASDRGEDERRARGPV